MKIRQTIVLFLITTQAALCTPAIAAPRETPVTGSGEPAAENPDLNELLLALTTQHPRIMSRARELAARLENARFRARVYPDPKVGVYWLNAPYKRDLRFIKDKTPMTGIEYRLTQPIPFPGRLTVESDIADLDAEESRLALALEKNALASEFLRELIDASTLRQTLTLAEETALNIKLITGAARARYSVGRGNLADVSRADLQQNAYEERVVRLRGELEARIRMLIFYLEKAGPVLSESDNKNSSPTIRKDEAKERKGDYRKRIVGLLAAGEPANYLGSLRETALEGKDKLEHDSLDVARSRIHIRKRERNATLANMKYLPDFELFAAFRKRAYIENDPTPAENFMSFGIAARIPLWSALANPSHVRGEERGKQAARMKMSEIALQVRTDYESARIRYDTSRERIRVYDRTLIPQGERTLDSSRQSYQTGKVDFEVFLQSWNALYALRSEKIRLQAEKEKELIHMLVLANRILGPGRGGTK